MVSSLSFASNPRFRSQLRHDLAADRTRHGGIWRSDGKTYEVESSLSLSGFLGRTLRRLTTSGVQCALLALVAFLPLAGITLLSPDQIGLPSQDEFLLASLVLVRFLTPLSACLMVTYLARQDGHLKRPLWSHALRNFLPSVGLVIGVMFFTGLCLLMLVVPGVGFLLGSTVALPIFLIEGTRIPEAVRLSWERTRELRGQLAGFWVLFLLSGVGILGGTAMFFTEGNPRVLLEAPLAQSDALLPLVMACSLLYGAMVCGSYEVYLASVENPSEGRMDGR